MRITFRAKLGLIVGSAALVLLLVALSSAWIGARQAQVLAEVEGHLVPRLEMGPRMEADFARLRQSMQDAVAAQDLAALDATANSRDALLELVAQSGQALEGSAALRDAILNYYATAHALSRRLIAGEMGEKLVEDLAQMQERHASVAAFIKKHAGLSREQLNAGFATLRDGKARADTVRLVISLGGVALVLGLFLWTSRSMVRTVNQLSKGFARFATGDFSRAIPSDASDELGDVAREANQMAANLRSLNDQRDRHDWLKTALAGLSDELRGELTPKAVAERALSFLARKVEACAGAIYLSDEGGRLVLRGAYAHTSGTTQLEAELPRSFSQAEGLLGQASLADTLLVVSEVPAGYLKIGSALGAADPRTLVFVPLRHLGKLVGVMELALFRKCAPEARELLGSTHETLAIAFAVAKARAAQQELLEQTQRLAERLTAQEEELRLSNQELRSQQEELRAANEELEAQRHTLSRQNTELGQARLRSDQKNEELARVSAYKSQFLANMSHELRTPLNSMLLLSHLLAENESKTLTPKEVDYAKTIHSAGKDLLALINQVLDRAKVEAGKQEVFLENVELRDFARHVERVFRPLADDKGLKLLVELSADAPQVICTDRRRVERILTNLLGNAIKFTASGEVTLRIERPQSVPGSSNLAAGSSVAFRVRDTGIGVPEEARERIFAPFEQVESRTDRRYGGTGLGLSIARESTRLLGGELELVSVIGEGSTFTCFLPDEARVPPDAGGRSTIVRRASNAPRGALDEDGHSEPPVSGQGPSGSEPPDSGNKSGDQKCSEPLASDENSEPRTGDRKRSELPSDVDLLVIEDDTLLAEQLVEIIQARHLRVLVAVSGSDGLRLATERRPHGIILDVKLPDLDGWTVMERLARDPATRSIPVHFISAIDAPERALALGAVGYLTKPATHAELVGVVQTLVPPGTDGVRRVLVVEEAAAAPIVELLRAEGFETEAVTSAGAALTAFESRPCACIILDLGDADGDGLRLLKQLQSRVHQNAPRVVVHTQRALTQQETRALEAYTEAVIMTEGSSHERLLEQLRLFVAHLKETMPKHQQRSGTHRASADVSLKGSKILITDDDMRTVYAVSALLRGKGAEVLVGTTGREALDTLDAHPDVNAVLMDVMMPEMDGYEAMRRLRQDERFAELPVIALTAKAMKGECERCREAGASDYLAKPVDSERLLLMLHDWLNVRKATSGAA